jgi:hypothetical protein
LIQDATLTGSASRFELTEDTFWLNRYNDNIPALDTAIEVSQALSQTVLDLQLYAIIDSVNAILIDKETIALDDPANGFSALYGQDYLDSKNIYNYAAGRYVQVQTSRIDGIIALN